MVDADAPNRPIMSVTSRFASGMDGGAKKGPWAQPFQKAQTRFTHELGFPPRRTGALPESKNQRAETECDHRQRLDVFVF